MANTPKTLLCVQLPGDVVSQIENAIREVAADAKVVQASYLDGLRLLEHCAAADLIFCAWDGVSGKTKGFVYQVRSDEKLRPKKIHCIIPESRKSDDKVVRDLKIDGALQAPQELFKLQMLIYDLVHAEEQASASQPAAAEGEDYSGPAIKKIGDLRLPPDRPDGAVLTAVKKAIDEIEGRNTKLRTELKDKSLFLSEPVIVHHPDPAGAAGLARQLRQFGCGTVLPFHTVSSAFAALYTELANLIVVWYDNTSPDATMLIREINEARSLPRVGVVVMVPGEATRLKFGEDHKRLLIDQVLERPKHRGEFVEKISAALEAMKDDTNPTSALHELRERFRVTRFGLTFDAQGETDFAWKTALIQKKADWAYWAQCETLLKLVRDKDTSKAASLSEQLVNAEPSSLDPVIFQAYVKALTEGPRPAAKWLASEAIVHRGLNPEKAHALALLFSRWKSPEALEILVENWASREDLPRDALFFHSLSKYYSLKNDVKAALACLKEAVLTQPLRIEFLFNLAKAFEEDRRTKLAVDTWRLASQVPHANPQALTRISRSLEKLGQRLDLAVSLEAPAIKVAKGA